MRRFLDTLASLTIATCVAAVATAGGAEPDAAQLLSQARAARAVWQHFPGFTAEATVLIDGRSERASIAVDKHGTVTSKLGDDKLRDWAEEQLGSVVDHRLPSQPDDEKPTFADSQTDHPLGRLIRLGDADSGSAYRIRGDVITEVNRRDGPERFTISVLQTVRNQEGKYLPQSFCVTVWDAENGQIKSSSSYLNEWKRVGNFDLPQRILEVETTPGGQRQAREITLDNYSLDETSK